MQGQILEMKGEGILPLPIMFVDLFAALGFSIPDAATMDVFTQEGIFKRRFPDIKYFLHIPGSDGREFHTYCAPDGTKYVFVQVEWSPDADSVAIFGKKIDSRGVETDFMLTPAEFADFLFGLKLNVPETATVLQ